MIMLPNTSGSRQQLALQAQEQLRQIGIRVELERIDFSVYNERRTRGAFDLDFAATNQDPSPSGLSQGWSCGGGTNVARYCDRAVDSLLDLAGRTRDHAAEAWQAVLRRIESDAPAVFMYALNYLTVVDRRFANVRIRPESLWLGLREWTLAADARSHPVGY
jgi:peptide/nickel transport system substrate-binding protein